MTRRIFDDDQFIYPRIYAEQQDIIKTSYDLHVLKKAMKSFKSLQRVTVLQTAGNVDLALRRLAYSSAAALEHQLHHQGQATHVWDYVYCSWAPASQRVVETLLQALQYGNSGIKSFVCPMISPQGLVRINHKIQQVALKGVWRQLTHLELSFDDKELSLSWLHGMRWRDQESLDERILLLSKIFFRDLFMTAENLSTIFLGFDHNRPLNIPLESVFHDISWSKLKSLGLESWRLSTKEIVDVVKRHRKTLRALRLGNVRLRDGDLWRDVVIALRRHARELQLVSLDGCGYEKEFDKWRQSLLMGNLGGGLGGLMPGVGHAAGDDGWTDELSMALGIEVDDISASDTDEPLEGNNHDDNGVEVVEYDHGGLVGAGTADASLPGQTGASGEYMLSSDHVLDIKLERPRTGLSGIGLDDEETILADNGQTITYAQRRRWEEWIVTGRHGSITSCMSTGGRFVGNGGGKGRCRS
ncbi:hypothetical protein BDZ91DRAFT_716376 [Kalaharituber pfeilii]|nr:hypothetical protein BDZ91DRAFT_716376 [Kalaharituber pfeilii]